jgi:hypothetical protein
MEIQAMNITKKGFDLTFTHPVDKKLGASPETYPFKRYYYEYHQDYGSKQFDLQPVRVKKVKVSRDGKRVSLELAEMKPGYVYELNITRVQSREGKPVLNTLVCYTLNKLKK